MKKSLNHGLNGLRDDTEGIEGYKKTEVGVIPSDWEVKRVGDICDFIVPGRNKPRKFEGDIPWITTPDLEDGRSVSKSRLGLCISIDEAKNVGSKIVPAGSVIMSCAGELGIVAFTDNKIVINQQLHAFIPSSIIHGLFLLNAIKTQKKYIDGVATKTAVPYINKDNCNSIPIPLPPLSEQKTIAQSLSDVDALITECDRIITKKRNTKQGTMQQLLTGKKRLSGFSKDGVRKVTETNVTDGYKHTEAGMIPVDWEVEELSQIVESERPISYGIVQTGKNIENGVRCIRVIDIADGKVRKENLIRTSEEISNSYKRTILKNGDLIIALRGKIGELAVIQDDLVGANLTRGIALICPKSNNYNYFLYHYLSSSNSKYILEKNLNGSALKEISIGVLRKIPAIIPPTIQEQTAIAQILSDMDTEITALEQKRDKYKAIKQGMMQELLTGKTRLISSY